MLPEIVTHLLAEAGAGIVHGEEDAEDGEVGIQATFLDFFDEVEDFADSLEGEVLTLDGDENFFRGDEGAGHEQADAGRAVEQDEIEGGIVFEGSEGLADAEVLRMTAAIADWAGKTKDAEQWQGRFYEAQARRELLSQDSPATEYLRIFEALQEAEKLEALKKTSEAEPKFRKVLKDLQRLRDHHPDWESSSIVQYRIRILEKKLASPQQKP